jgi:hypothetical protein
LAQGFGDPRLPIHLFGCGRAIIDPEKLKGKVTTEATALPSMKPLLVHPKTGSLARVANPFGFV